MLDTGSFDTVAQGIMVVVISVVDIEQAGIGDAIIQLAYSRQFSSSRYPPSFPAATEVLCSIFRHDLPIYKIYNTY